jgi:hypothetical protein
MTWRAKPYYASRDDFRWYRRTDERGAPKIGDMIVNTQGVLCAVVDVNPIGQWGGRGWLTTAGWTTSAARYLTPEELAVVQMDQAGGL